MKGYIYILTNPSFREYVKIGYADNVEERVASLNASTAVPFSFHVYATLEVKDRCSDRYIHNLIDMMRPELRSIEKSDGGKVTRQREFFRLDPEDAYELLVQIAGLTGGRLKRAEQSRKEVAETVIADKNRSKFEETLAARKAFWSEFIEYANSQPAFSSIYKKHSASGEHWLSFGSGKGGCVISGLINVREGYVGVEFYINKNKSLFEKLYACKDKIEQDLGFEMDWQPLEEKDASRVIVKNELGDFRTFSPEVRQRSYSWMVDKMLTIRRVFARYW